MAVSKVVFNGETLVDLTADTVVAEALAEGYTAHDAAGNAVVGTLVANGSDCKEATIAANSWVSGDSYYTVTIEDEDVAAGDMIIAMAANDTSKAECNTILNDITTSGGEFTLYSNVQHDTAVTILYIVCKTPIVEEVLV